MIHEGQKVSYAGDSQPFIEVGTPAKVIAMSGLAAHCQWQGGPRVGQIDLIDLHELVPYRSDFDHTAVRSSAEFSEALDVPMTQTISVRATYDQDGEEGLVNALSESGHLAMLGEYVDEAVGHIASRIRTDANFAEVLGSLEADEADALVSRVASVVLSDRLSEGY